MRFKRGYDYSDYEEFDNDYMPESYQPDDQYDSYIDEDEHLFPDFDDEKTDWTDTQSDTYDWQDWEDSDEDSYNTVRRRKTGLAVIPKLGVIMAIIAVVFFVFGSISKKNQSALPTETLRPQISPEVQQPEITEEDNSALTGVSSVSDNTNEIELSLLYYRALLNSEEKLLYDVLCDEIERQPDIITGIHAKNCEQLDKVLRFVQADHPEYFWITGAYSFIYFDTEDGIDIDLTLSYEMDIQQRFQMQSRIDAIVEYIMSSLGGLSEYEKVKGVYEYLINNAVYDLSNGGQTICPVLVEGRGVCASYAKSTQFLLQQLGVQAIILDGTARNGESHAWNIVRIDGDFYQLDTTWGDPVTEDGSQIITYDYFCLTSQEMYMDHIPSGSLPVPDCTATACNYFRKEGRFTNVYDEDWLLNLFSQDITNKRKIIFRVSDENVYRQYCNTLFNKSEIFYLLEQINDPAVDMSGVSHSINDQLYIITIYLNYL